MSDRHRPLHHISAHYGWVNDPNGPILHEGTYHVFAQHNPAAPTHDKVHWAHWTSPDLATWTEQPVALSPRPGGSDADGCWSGSAIAVDGEIILVYSGYRSDDRYQSVCVARPTGDRTWVADEKPVLLAPPDAVDAALMRDPFLWQVGDEYRMMLGSGDASGRPLGLVFGSSDLEDWHYIGPIVDPDDAIVGAVDTGQGWECPQLLVRGDQAVLLLSAWSPPSQLDGVFWVAGGWDGHQLRPRAIGRVDYGPDFYAADLMDDATVGAVSWGWCWEGRENAVAEADGWAGVLSVPRTVTLDPEGLPVFAPVAEFATLRGEATSHDVRLDPSVPVVLGASVGTSFDLEARLRPGDDGIAWIRVLADPDGVEFTEIGVDRAAGEVYVDRSAASVSDGVHRGRFSMPVEFDDAGAADLRVVVDVSVVEVFAAGRSLTTRVYPSLETSTGLHAGAVGGPARVELTCYLLPGRVSVA